MRSRRSRRSMLVGGVWKDGIPGWADSFQGISAMLTALGSGAIARLPLDLKSRFDGIPVDIVASSMIVSAGYRLSMSGNSIPIVHCNSSSLNPFIFEKVQPTSMECSLKYPFENMVATPAFSHLGWDCTERYMHQLRKDYLGPALDGIGSLIGKKPFWTRLYGRIADTYIVLKKFLTDYTFRTDNLLLLMDMMAEEDRETFDIDVRKINWNEYVFDLQLGIKVFLMRDDIVDHTKVQSARRKLRLLQLKDFITTFVICYMCSLACTGSSTVWQLSLPLTLVVYCYCSVFTHKPCDVPSIHEYKRRVEEAMGAPLEALKKKN